MHDNMACGPSFQGDSPAASDDTVLIDRRELALVAVERTRMPMVITDARKPDCPIVLANHAFLDLTGYTAEEVIGRNCRFLQGPATSPAEIALIRSGLASDEDVEVELLNYRKDGTTFWNRLAITPVFDDHGTLLYYFGSQKDVTARRRAEEAERAERLLLMEVDHRALNALALVQSFVRLSRTDTAETYATSVQQRVDAIARAHQLLAADGWTGTELGALVASGIPATLSNRVFVEGPRQSVSPRIVQPLALALYELMANAVLWGALATPEGALELSWEQNGRNVVLRWAEKGLPRPVVPPPEGLGISLVRGVIERQLGGTVTMNWAENGLIATLAFPPDGTSRTHQPSASFRPS